MTSRIALFSGGHGHAFGQTSAALHDLFVSRGDVVAIGTDFDACVDGLEDTDLLVVNALRWSMTQHEKYAPFRAVHAFRPQPGSMDRLVGWVRGGGRLLALHTAVICFDTEPGWLDLLGGGWRWGVSHHPPRGDLRIEPAAAPAFDLVDEAYHHMGLAADADVWASCALSEGRQPVVWTRRPGAGRVAVDTLGHDRPSLENPGHARLIGRLVDWLLSPA